jgi:long-chain fatty acid transport protein
MLDSRTAVFTATSAALFASLALHTLAAPAAAGGLYLNEFGTPSQGTAGAGAGAWAPDASIALYNPAGMTRLEDHEFAGGLSLLAARIEFDPSASNPTPGSDGGNQGGLAPVTSANYVHRISDRLRLGLSLFSVSGSVLDPRSNWVGRFEVKDLSLLTISGSPTLAVRLTDWLSLGGGPVFTYGVLEWDLKVPLPGPGNRESEISIDVDDTAPSGRIGGLFHPTPELQLAVFYQSETELDLSGDVGIPLGVEASLDLDLPLAQFIRASAYWEVTERVALLATFAWEDWSTLENTPVSIANRSVRVPLGFKDTFKIGGGIHYRWNDEWLLQAGVNWDSSPLDSDDRITALPVDQQLRVAVGAIHPLSDNVDLGLSFVFADLGDGKVRSSTVRGHYDQNYLFVFGATLSFHELWWSGAATL